MKQRLFILLKRIALTEKNMKQRLFILFGRTRNISTNVSAIALIDQSHLAVT